MINFDRREEQRENVIDKDGGCRRVLSRQRIRGRSRQRAGQGRPRDRQHCSDEINAKGGVNGQKLQLVVYDDGVDANAARTFATRLIEEDKVVAMIGGTTTVRSTVEQDSTSKASAPRPTPNASPAVTRRTLTFEGCMGCAI